MTTKMLKINFVGDVMLGRLIDQLFKTSVDEPSEAKIVRSFVENHPSLKSYGPASPWGSTLPLFHSSDLNIINLETSVTTNARKWPDKVFNYRMHPANVNALKAANVDYTSLANNHTLDFSEKGLEDTVEALKRQRIHFAGAGSSREEAFRPAQLKVPRDATAHEQSDVLVWSASDHPAEWSKVGQFHLIDYTDKTKSRLKDIIVRSASDQQSDRRPLKVFSVHWGPNYLWTPAQEIQSLAHFLIDECGIDVIHGHSSHHIQGVEKYHGKLIIYGCGDFVDDYALVPGYRNNLSAVWRLNLLQSEGTLKPRKLEVFPSRIRHFQAELLETSDPDHDWVRSKLSHLSSAFGTVTQDRLGENGQIVIDLP